MPELAADRWGPAEAVAETPNATRVRWLRVVAVALGFVFAFYLIEHEPEQFAGVQIGDNREDRIADQYIDSIEGGNALRQLVIISYGMLGFAALATCRERVWNARWFAVALLAGLFLWAVMSSAWSDDPRLVAKRLAVLGLMMTGSLGCARLLRPNELIAVALVSLTALVSYSFLTDLGAGARPWKSTYRFSGTLHPNIQAAYCGVLCLAAFALPVGFGRRWITRTLFAYGFVLLILTQSRTSALAVLVGVLMVFVVRLGPSVRWWAVATLASLAALATITFSTLGDGGRRQLQEALLMGRTEDAGSLTGRVPLWQELATFAAERPMTGFGYETFWTPDRIDAVMKSQKWAIQSAHNGYFEIALQLGFVGLALALGVLVSGFNLTQSAYARTGLAGYAFVYGVLAFAMANSLLEAHFAKLKYPTVLALIGLFSVAFFFPQESPDDEPTTPLSPTTAT